MAIAFVGYMLPTLVGLWYRRRRRLAIFLINFFFGWTVVGWFLPLLMAFADDPQKMGVSVRRVPPSSSSGGGEAGGS
jgi:hypothetical protein